jgi:hypothetical protein
MLKAGGYYTINDPATRLQEHDTQTCQHCNRLVRFQAFQRLEDRGGRCSQCDGFICQRCQAKLHKTLFCDHFDKRLRRMEAKWALDEAMREV